MLQTFRRLSRIVAGYGAVQWAGPLLSLIFTPIITRLVGPGDYGLADFVLTVGAAAGTLSLFAIPQALAAHYNDRADGAHQRSLIGSALALTWSIAIPVGLLLVAFGPAISLLMFGSDEHGRLFQLTGATTFFGVTSAVLVAAAQASLRVRWGMAFSLATILATATANIVFIIVLRLTALGLVLVAVSPAIVVTVLGLGLMRGSLGRPDAAALGTLARSGATLLPTAMASWALMMGSRFFLVQNVTTEALGHFAIATKISGLAYVALTPLYSGWTSLALAMQHDADARRQYAIMSRYLVAAALFVCLGLGLFATEILIVLTRPAYFAAAPYVGFLAYVQVFSALGTALYTSALASKKLGAVSWTVVAGAVVSLGLSALLIPSLGLWGATAATVVGYALPQVLLYPIVQRAYPVSYPIGRMMAALLVETALLLLGLLVPPVAFPVRLALKTLLLAVLPVALLGLGIVTPVEIRLIREQIVRRVSRWRSASNGFGGPAHT